MKLFSYDEKSFLNNDNVRTLNYIILGIILIGGISNATSLSLSFGMCIIISFFVSILSSVITLKVIYDTEFFEWDYTERKKKFRFTIKYMLLCVFISSLFIFSIVIAYLAISENNMPLLGKALFIFPIVFFAFNMCNIISLYHPIFGEDIILGYKIQKKPDNWQDRGQEITNEDKIRERMYRDFGI